MQTPYYKPSRPATHKIANAAARLNPRCGGCRFFYLPHDEYWSPEMGERLGECRRHSPTIGLGDYGRGGGWPTIHDDQWCGEFEALN
jgi:hypothetical protein